ncbi:hypothetical protein HWV62_39423 [Athelia sp. TMB]|nr:hypothetical protein HWV62_39423 [Athelia sp. TMB]
MGATIKLTREQVAARILKGEHIVIYNQQAIRVPDSWLDIHPGGFLTILHFIGRDATDEIQAYHDDDTLKRLQKFAIGTVDGLWQPLQPPIMTGWRRRPVGPNGQREWVKEGDTLITKEDTDLSPSAQVLLVEKQPGGPSLPNLIPPPSSLNLKQEAQHSAAYRKLHQRVKEAGLYKTPFITGYGPELARYLLFSGLSAYAYFNNWLFTSAVFLGMFWHQLVFTCHDLGHRGVTADVTWDRLISVFLADFVGGLSIGWWVDSHNVHHLVTNHPSHDPDIQLLPFFAVTPDFIVLSHYSMSTADMGPTESFPRRQLRTTTDVTCPPSLQFLHGGLHLQVTHHLFPRLPRHNLRAASALVKVFAKEQGLTYNEFGFVEGNKDVVNHLRGVAEQIAILGRVAEAEVREQLEVHNGKGIKAL